MTDGSLTNYAGDAFLQYYLFDNGPVYLALHNAEPTIVPDPSTEFAGNEYARQLCTWTTPSNKTSGLAAAVIFPDLPDDTLRWFGVWDAPSGSGPSAHLLFAIPRITSFSDFTIEPLPLTTADNLTVPANDIVIGPL